LRTVDSYVSSEDIKDELGADSILFCPGISEAHLMITKDKKWIGCIEPFCMYLGDDDVIRKIHIYGEPELSKRLTDKYQFKILVPSRRKDEMG
jgi:hypothetical protein